MTSDHEPGAVEVEVVLGSAADLPAHERWRLLEAASGVARSRLLAAGSVDAAVASRFEALAAARRTGTPLQYLESIVPFGPVELVVDSRALIPRPETERLWEIATDLASPLAADAVIVDLCTGSGNLAFALEHSFPDHEIHACDISEAALGLAAVNAARLESRVHLWHGDLYDALPAGIRGAVGLLVANPPYLSGDELATLPAEVREFEPHVALVAGARGDEVVARIAAGLSEWLRSDGTFVIEISEFEPERWARHFDSFDAEVREDLAGRPRFVVGRAGDAGRDLRRAR